MEENAAGDETWNSDAASIAGALSAIRLGRFGPGPADRSLTDRRRHGHHRRGHDSASGGGALARILIALISTSDPLGVGELGQRIGVDQPRASRLVTQGVEQGLLRRQVDPEDGRRLRVVLTQLGEEQAKTLLRHRTEMVSAALTDFSAEERQQLAELLGRLAAGWPEVRHPRP